MHTAVPHHGMHRNGGWGNTARVLAMAAARRAIVNNYQFLQFFTRLTKLLYEGLVKLRMEGA
jgi:hypothetical protein